VAAFSRCPLGGVLTGKRKALVFAYRGH